MERMKRLIAIGCTALAAATCAFGRDTAIYNGKLTSDLNANGNAVTSLKEPNADSDAATKKYVDAATAGAGKVQSVNSQTGAVVITAASLGAVATGDFATATNALAEAIAKAEPGDYAAVSNAAMTALQPAATNGLASAASVTASIASATNGLASLASLAPLSSQIDSNKTAIATKADATTLNAYSNELATAISNATPSDYETVKSKAESALQSETDPAFAAWNNGTNIVIGLNASISPYSIGDGTTQGVAIGPNTFGYAKSFSTSYDAAHFYVGAVYSNGTNYAESLKDLLSNATPSDYATVKANASSALSTANANKSSIATINSAGYVTQTTADASYYPKASGDAWSAYWDGDDVRVTVTNYDSVAHLPTLYLEQRTNDTASASTDEEAFRVVWREMAHWDAFLGSTWNWEDATWQGFDSWRSSLSSALDEKADRAWGFYDSHTGKYAPDGYTSISSSNVMICAGASYQKTATATCDVWVLTADEPYEPTGISTNGGFQIKDADGNVQFEIVKGNKRTVKAQANGVTVEDSTTLVVTYNIVAAEAPTGEVCLELANAQWKAQTDSDCPATVEWSGSSGAWVARITPTTSTTRCFFKASYETGGDDYINNRAPVGMSQLVLNGTTYNLGTATIDGHTVLTLTPAN
jgi:hypothetical protein